VTRIARDLVWPDDEPELVPFLPFVFSVWVDGSLTAAELAALGRTVDSLDWLRADTRSLLASWLDPGAPPTPSALHALRTRIRGRVPVQDKEARHSLTGLGLALWRQSSTSGPWERPETHAVLRSLEKTLGLLGGEAARSALGLTPPQPEKQMPSAGFEGSTLRSYLGRDRSEARGRALAALTVPALRIPRGLPTAEYRERVLAALQYIADEGLGRLGYPVEFGGSGDPAAAVAVFETLAFGDLSVVVKLGVQFGLFGGSVLQLGTERHHRAYLGAIGSLELPGCYAMTETGHGSNVRDLETTAHFDPATDQLVVHTPHRRAAKDYIGNAAAHGLLATVFARLIVADEDHGVHAILVPLRDERRRPLPGIRIEDCGLKEGLNGVDNGRIWFDHVRVPRANLLDRFATIDDQGRYHSDIPSSGRRFFRMLRTLVIGRISIAAASVSTAKVGLTIAVRYAASRRQFGPEGASEVAILDYPLIQRELMPRLATVLGLHFAVRRLEQQLADAEHVDSSELEVAAAGLKAYASDHCVATLQAAREACGGAGYLAENRFAALKADTDVFTTFEGANLVLYQLVAKGLLSRFREEMGDLTLGGAVRYLAERAETALTELNPLVTRRTDDEHLLDPEFHRAALAYREARLLRSAAMRIRARLDDGVDSFRAVVECQDHLVSLARAHVERVVLEAFDEAIVYAPTPGLSEVLASASALYALACIERDRGWFLESGYVEAAKARAIRARVGALCGDLREHAELLVGGFGIPDEVLPEMARRGGSAGGR
jgi:acyl-CoA oxidase